MTWLMPMIRHKNKNEKKVLNDKIRIMALKDVKMCHKSSVTSRYALEIMIVITYHKK